MLYRHGDILCDDWYPKSDAAAFAARRLKAFFVIQVREAEMANNRPVLLGRSIRRL